MNPLHGVERESMQHSIPGSSRGIHYMELKGCRTVALPQGKPRRIHYMELKGIKRQADREVQRILRIHYMELKENEHCMNKGRMIRAILESITWS